MMSSWIISGNILGRGLSRHGKIGEPKITTRGRESISVSLPINLLVRAVVEISYTMNRGRAVSLLQTSNKTIVLYSFQALNQGASLEE